MMLALIVLVGSALTSTDTNTGWSGVYAPWPDRLLPSSGRSYVVLSRNGGPRFRSPFGTVSVSVAQRANDQRLLPAAYASVTSGEDEHGVFFDWHVTPDVKVRDGDRILYSETLARPPMEILVSSSGSECVLVDTYGPNELGDNPRNCSGLTSIALDNGEVIRKARTLVELFGVDEAALILTAREVISSENHTNWLRGAWLDESTRSAIVVAHPRSIRRVSCVTDLILVADAEAAWKHIEKSDGPANLVAIELVCEHMDRSRAEIIRQALKRVHRSKAESARMFMALAVAGDRQGKAELIALLLDGEYQSGFKYGYVLDKLDKVLGTEAIPICLDYLSSEESDVVAKVLERLEESAYPYVLGLLKSTNTKERMKGVQGVLALADGKFAGDAIEQLRMMERDSDEEVSEFAHFWAKRLEERKR